MFCVFWLFCEEGFVRSSAFLVLSVFYLCGLVENGVFIDKMLSLL